MEQSPDIRWTQRFANYQKALAQLSRFVQQVDLNEMEQQGLIKAFEYTFEMAWLTIKDFYKNQGEADIQGSRDAFRLAFGRELIADGETWMAMIKSRQLTVHTYNPDTAEEVSTAVKGRYHKAFKDLEAALLSHLNNA